MSSLPPLIPVAANIPVLVAFVLILAIAVITKLIVFFKRTLIKYRLVRFFDTYFLLFITALILVNAYIIAPALSGSMLFTMYQFISPEIKHTYPSSNDNDVALREGIRDKGIRVIFNVPIDNKSITSDSLKLMNLNTSTTVSGTVRTSDSDLKWIYVELRPTTQLQPYTKYSVSIDDEIKDIFGRTISKGMEWGFTTGNMLEPEE